MCNIYNMSRMKREKYEGATYHAYSIGNLKRRIFQDEAAIRFFLGKLEEGSRKHGVRVHAYCVMGTHFHLLLTTPEPNISEFMHGLLSSYGSYMVKRGWPGHVFARRFDSIVVREQDYLRKLVSYIHLNPVRAGIADRPEDYPWSSWRAYIAPGVKTVKVGDGYGNDAWLDTASVLRQFDSDPAAARKRLEAFVLQGLSGDHAFPGERVIARAVYGSEENAGEIRRLLSGEPVPYDSQERKRLLKAQGLEEVYELILEQYGLEGLEVETLPTVEERKRAREARKAFIYLAKKHTIATNGEIARVLGNVGATLVSSRYGKAKRLLESGDSRGEPLRRLEGLLETERRRKS